LNRNPDVLARRMQEALARHDWPQALKACDGLLAAMSDHAALHYNRALVLRKLGRDEEAAAGFEKAIERDHDNARFELGSIRLEAGDAAGAAALFERFLEYSPDDADAKLNLGNAKLALGEPDEALRLLSAAHAVAPSDLSLRSLAIACRDTGDHDACRRLLGERQKTQANAADNLKILTQGSTGRISLASRALGTS